MTEKNNEKNPKYSNRSAWHSPSAGQEGNTNGKQQVELTELMSCIPLHRKQAISEMLFPANLLTSTEWEGLSQK